MKFKGFRSSVAISLCLLFVAVTVLLEFGWLDVDRLNSIARFYTPSSEADRAAGVVAAVNSSASNAESSTSTNITDVTYQNVTVQPTDKVGDAALLEEAAAVVRAIMTPDDEAFPRMKCPLLNGTRYNLLRAHSDSKMPQSTSPRYFFALDIHQSAALLPRLLGSIVEAIRFLGPADCVLSVVEGRSDDGTFEVLVVLRREIEALGARYVLSTNEADPLAAGTSRIEVLAELRNQAVLPLVQAPEDFAPDATVVFVNDVAICRDDLLELILQRRVLGADMTCAMDWTYVGADPTFYDVWVARGLTGDSFFEIPPDGNWNSAWNLFWNDETARTRLQASQPFQVFSCWNGATAFGAAPLLRQEVRFRGPVAGRCFQGEPQLFCTDLWAAGRGKIAVVPSVNLEYSDEAGEKIKAAKGFVSERVDADGHDGQEGSTIKWQLEPPPLVKCIPSYEKQDWVAWNESVIAAV